MMTLTLHGRFHAAGLLVCFLTVFPAAGYASERPVVLGTTWKIAEDDMLAFIEGRIRSMQENGQMDVLQKQFQNRVRKKVDRPESVTGIRRTQTPRTHTYDPSVVVNSDLMDESGHVFAKAGDRVNPLQIHTPSTWLVFFDGDDSRQVAWMDDFVKSHPGRIRPVLVSGSVSGMSRHLQQPVYFDQAGKLTSRLEIHQVPAIVGSDGDHLLIGEVIP